MHHAHNTCGLNSVFLRFLCALAAAAAAGVVAGRQSLPCPLAPDACHGVRAVAPSALLPGTWSALCCSQADVYNAAAARAFVGCMARTPRPFDAGDSERLQVDLALGACFAADDAQFAAFADGAADAPLDVAPVPPPPTARGFAPPPYHHAFALVPHVFQHTGRPNLYSNRFQGVL